MLQFTGIGNEYTGTEEGKAALIKAIEALEWISTPKVGEPPITLPMMQGMALKDIIREWKIPAVAIAHAPYVGGTGLLAVRTTLGQEIYLVDEGTAVVPVALTVEEEKK